MAHLVPLLPAIWPWLILIAAQLSVMSGQQRLGLILLGLFGTCTLALGLITPTALAIAILGLLGAAGLRRLSGIAAAAGHLALILWCFAQGAHLFPGFHNLLVLDRVLAGPDSAAFSMYLNLDKPLVLFAVLLALPGAVGKVQRTNSRLLITGLLMLPGLFLLGLSTGAIRPEIGLPPWWLIFALSNLFLTCLTEEAFFRGYLQSLFIARLRAPFGIAAAGLLFGLVHLGGGVALVFFATLLGIACGLGYFATGRLWVPVLMHFAFNALHLLLFTYPGPA